MFSALPAWAGKADSLTPVTFGAVFVTLNVLVLVTFVDPSLQEMFTLNTPVLVRFAVKLTLPFCYSLTSCSRARCC
jgi:hypothetical protein